MAQPLPYERDYDFQNFQSGHPSTPLPGDKVNAELDQVAATLDEVLVRIALLQDDDTALKRKSVGRDQLADNVDLGFDPPTTWTTATAYTAGNTVFSGTAFYKCLASHTSGTFATDLAAGKWELLADFTSATADAEAAQAAAEAAQALAEAARDSATASASSASSNAASASASANSASADAEQTAADRIATAADRVATAADRVQTGLDVVSSAASAAAAAASAASIVVGPGGVQEYSENLAAIADLDKTDGNFIVGTGSAWGVESGATARASLGLGSAAVATLIDDDTMATASAANIASAESVKAYVDNGAIYVNVLREGVVADDTTDVTAAVQAIINGMPANGGTIFFPTGTYWFAVGSASLTCANGNVRFLGEGRDSSILHFEEGPDTAHKKNLFQDTSGTLGTKGSIAFEHLQIRGTLDEAERYGTSGMWLEKYSCVRITDCKFKNIAGMAMSVHSVGRFECWDNYFEDIGADAIRCRDTMDQIVTRNTIIRCGDDPIALHTADYQVQADLAAGLNVRERIVVTDNIMSNVWGALKVISARCAVITGNVITLPRVWGISLLCSTNTEGTNQMLDVIVADNVIHDLIGGSDAIVVGVHSARGATATNSVKPGRYDSVSGEFIKPWDWYQTDYEISTDALTGAPGMVVRGNIYRRTRPAVAAFSEYDLGEVLRSGAYTDPAVTDSDLTPSSGVSVEGSTGVSFDAYIEDNVLENISTGIVLNCDVSDNLSIRASIKNNSVVDFISYGVMIYPHATQTMNIDIEGNRFGGDIYRRATNSNFDGTYDANALPVGISFGNARGINVRRNDFRNVCSLFTFNAYNIYDENTVFMSIPAAALGSFSTGNKGIGVPINDTTAVTYVIGDADPTSATYGQIDNIPVRAASAMPSTGWYPIGWFVHNTGTGGNLGWQRLTTGSGHTARTDWIPVAPGVSVASKTWDPGSLVDGATTTTTLAVSGLMGDPCVPSFSLDLQGMIMTAYIHTTGSATVVLQNETGGTIDLGSGTLKVTAFRS